jgi:hypothetical protein
MPRRLDDPFPAHCGAVAEWSKALAWKVSIRQNRIEGSNPSRSAIMPAQPATAIDSWHRNAIGPPLVLPRKLDAKCAWEQRNPGTFMSCG